MIEPAVFALICITPLPLSLPVQIKTLKNPGSVGHDVCDDYSHK